MAEPKKEASKVKIYEEDNKDDQKELAKLLEKAKAEHPTIEYQFVVEDKIFYLRKIDRNTLQSAMGDMVPVRGKPKLIDAGELIINTCWVCGDEEIRSNDDYFIPACLQACGAIDQKAAFFKKK